MDDSKKSSRAKERRQFAAALRYSPYDESAPRLTAKGHGKLAEKIIRMAKENGVPVRQDRDLVQVLSRLDLNDEIPPAIYAAVAEILAFLYRASLEEDVSGDAPAQPDHSQEEPSAGGPSEDGPSRGG